MSNAFFDRMFNEVRADTRMESYVNSFPVRVLLNDVSKMTKPAFRQYADDGLLSSDRFISIMVGIDWLKENLTAVELAAFVCARLDVSCDRRNGYILVFPERWVPAPKVRRNPPVRMEADNTLRFPNMFSTGNVLCGDMSA